MKIQKKSLKVALLLMSLFSLASCGDNEKEWEDEGKPTPPPIFARNPAYTNYWYYWMLTNHQQPYNPGVTYRSMSAPMPESPVFRSNPAVRNGFGRSAAFHSSGS